MKGKVLNYKPFFLSSKDVLSLVVIFNLKWLLSRFILSICHYVLTFIIDISNFHNGLKYLCSLVSILRGTLWKVVMKCKLVMLFNFSGSFLKMLVFEAAKFYLTKYQISSQLIFCSSSLYLQDSCFWWGNYYYIGVELYTFFVLVVLSPLPSIFSALLKDSLFWSSFPASDYLRSTLEGSCRTPWGFFILAVLPPLLSICPAPSRTPLSWIWVLAQGPSTWVNLRYLEYLRKGLNHRSSLVILSTCSKSLNNGGFRGL